MYWTKLTDHAAWNPRDSMGLLAFEDRLWLLGGFTPERVNDVWTSTDGTDWERIVDEAAWPPRNLPGAAVYDDRLWIVGGVRGDEGCYNDVWWSENGGQWHCVTEDTPFSPMGGRNACALPRPAVGVRRVRGAVVRRRLDSGDGVAAIRQMGQAPRRTAAGRLTRPVRLPARGSP